MRKLICGFMLLFMISSSEAQILLDTSKHELNISTGKIQRLTDGVGFIDNKQTGSIQAAIKNDVALLNLTITDTIGAKQNAGIFFDNIPQLKHGVTIWRYKPWNSWTKPIAI